MNTESRVSARYAEGAKEVQPSLCCPVNYDAALLKCLPQEIIDKDYGCGDPSRYVRPGDTVLDLGSGGGKICYMAAQLVGDTGSVIGVDMTDEMLALARKYQVEMAAKLGGDRVSFRKGYIQDLALDVDARADYLAAHPDATDTELAAWEAEQKRSRPLVADASIDIVVSNCVLNLVDESHRVQMFRELFRVLRPGGRVAISDIVSDEEVPAHLKADDTLWSGCISGAFQEQRFLDAFLDAGFVHACYDKWDEEPWQVVEGIEFRSVTVLATKPDRAGVDAGHSVIYRGPFAELATDEGLVFRRGVRTVVSPAEFDWLRSSDAADGFVFLSPQGCCAPKPRDIGDRVRAAADSKGLRHLSGGRESGKSGGCC